MKPGFPSLTILLLLTICLIKSVLSFEGYYSSPYSNYPSHNEENGYEFENQPIEDSIPALSDYYENATYEGDEDPPFGNTIQPAFGYIVPDEYQEDNSSNSSNTVTLQVGAQFIAENAFLKNLFINTNHAINKVYDRNISHSPDVQDIDGESVDLGNYTYSYDVELLSSYHERLRTQFSIITSVYNGTINFWMTKFTFRYNTLLRGDNVVLQLSWWRNGADDETFQYSLADDQTNPYTVLGVENTSLTLGQNYTINEFLSLEGWERTNNSLTVTDYYVNYCNQVGYNFVNYQLQNPPVNSSIYNISEVLNVYEKKVSDLVTKYRFNVESGLFNNANSEKANISYEMIYDERQDYYYIIAWSVMTHYIPSSLP